MEPERKRGRPRKYPLCPVCNKSVKPDQDSGEGKHKKCTKQDGDKSKKYVPKITKPEDHPVYSEADVRPKDEVKPVQRADVRPKNKIKGQNDTSNLPEGFTAKEAAEAITNTIESRRYVIKHEGKFYLTTDPEKGISGEGFISPTRLLGAFLRATGILKIGEQHIYCQTVGRHAT